MLTHTTTTPPLDVYAFLNRIEHPRTRGAKLAEEIFNGAHNGPYTKRILALAAVMCQEESTHPACDMSTADVYEWAKTSDGVAGEYSATFKDHEVWAAAYLATEDDTDQHHH